VYLFNIVCNHVFQDGNKRTGMQAAVIFLQLNGYGLAVIVDDDLLTNFTLSVASGEQSLEQVQAWFETDVTAL